MQARVERGAAVPAAPPRPVPFKAVYRGRPRIAAFARQAETVPFTRSNLIDVISDRCGKYVERRALEPSSLPARGDPLSSLYRCWCDLRAAGACRFSSIDSVPLTRAGSSASCMSSMSATSTRRNFARSHRLRYADRPPGVAAGRSRRDHGRQRDARLKVRLPDRGAAPASHALPAGQQRLSLYAAHLPFLDEHTRVTRPLVMIREEAGKCIAVEPGD